MTISLSLALRNLGVSRRKEIEQLKKDATACRRTLFAVAGPAAAGDIVARATRERVSKRLANIEEMLG